MKNTIGTLTSLMLLLFATTLLSACAGLPKQPWLKPYEQGLLEDKIMQRTRHKSINQFRQVTYRATGSASGATPHRGGRSH